MGRDCNACGQSRGLIKKDIEQAGVGRLGYIRVVGALIEDRSITACICHVKQWMPSRDPLHATNALLIGPSLTWMYLTVTDRC